MEQMLSAGQYQRETGLTAGQIRALEAAGKIRPVKSSAGWRMWPPGEVAKGRALKAKQTARRRGGWREKESAG